MSFAEANNFYTGSVAILNGGWRVSYAGIGSSGFCSTAIGRNRPETRLARPV